MIKKKNTVHCQSKLLNLYFIRRKEGDDKNIWAVKLCSMYLPPYIKRSTTNLLWHFFHAQTCSRFLQEDLSKTSTFWEKCSCLKKRQQISPESDVLWPEFLRAGLQIGLSVKGFGSICVFSICINKTHLTYSCLGSRSLLSSSSAFCSFFFSKSTKII